LSQGAEVQAEEGTAVMAGEINEGWRAVAKHISRNATRAKHVAAMREGQLLC